MRDLFGEEIDDIPIQRKQDRTNADRQARHAAQRSDIGELPAVADQGRKASCRDDIVAFGLAYCSALLKRDPPPRMRDYAEDLRRAILNGGLVHVRLPRGSGKTTWIKIAIVWGVSYGFLKYPVVFQAGAALGAAILDDIWAVMEGDDAYYGDFPEVAYPIRCLEGLQQRAAGQHYHNVRTRIRRTSTQINLPVIDGAESSGAVIMARGAGCACRGMVHGSMRPDFVLLDDVQTRADAASKAKTDKLVAWILQDVMGLAGDQQLSAAMASTPILPGDLSDTFADGAEHPEWRLVEHRLVERWPEAEALWEEYDARWTNCLASGDTTAERATEFYRAHREAMDRGADCLDDGLFDARFELSAIQHARNLLLRVGRRAFDAEYQLAPAKQDDAISIDAKDVMRALNGVPRRVLPPGTREAVAFVDVMADRLHYAVAAFGRHQTVAVIDYGVWPETGRATPKNAPQRELEAALARALASLGERLLKTEYRSSDGGSVRLHALWFDCGWQTRVTHRICSLFRRRGYANVYGAKGYSAAYYNGGGGRHVIARGVNVDFREVDGERWAAQNSDVWKETAQRGFLGVPLQPGSISLWGTDKTEHFDFAGQVTAERLADKAVSSRGVEMYRWTLKPGAANHYLDALGGCMAMGSWYRYWEGDDAVVGAARAVREAMPPESGASGPVSAPTGKRIVAKARRRYRSAKIT